MATTLTRAAQRAAQAAAGRTAILPGAGLKVGHVTQYTLGTPHIINPALLIAPTRKHSGYTDANHHRSFVTQPAHNDEQHWLRKLCEEPNKTNTNQELLSDVLERIRELLDPSGEQAKNISLKHSQAITYAYGRISEEDKNAIAEITKQSPLLIISPSLAANIKTVLNNPAIIRLRKELNTDFYPQNIQQRYCDGLTKLMSRITQILSPQQGPQH